MDEKHLKTKIPNIYKEKRLSQGQSENKVCVYPFSSDPFVLVRQPQGMS